jgi:hypothetical protein
MDAARQDYITNPDSPSLKTTSEKHGVPYGTIGDRSVREGWLEKREDYHDRVASESLHRAVRAAAKKKVKDIKLLDSICDGVLGDLDSRLQAKRAYQESVQEWASLPKDERASTDFPEPSTDLFQATPADADKLLRLKQFMCGDPDSRMEITGEVKTQITLVVQRVIDAIRNHVSDAPTRRLVCGELEAILESQADASSN